MVLNKWHRINLQFQISFPRCNCNQILDSDFSPKCSQNLLESRRLAQKIDNTLVLLKLMPVLAEAVTVKHHALDAVPPSLRLLWLNRLFFNYLKNDH